VARDEQALAELIELATPWLLGVAQAMLSDPGEAEEVVHEAFTIVWNRIGQVPNEPRGLLAWVLRVARNRAIDRLRSRQRRQRKSAHVVAHGMDGQPFAQAEEPNEAGTPGWHVHETVHAALAALPRDQQIVVRLAYFHGLTHSAIAQRLGIPVGTVKTRLRLAFDKLRPALASMKDWML
jgi:RNA polymerase sigma-70 factor (ECF subfamily)